MDQKRTRAFGGSRRIFGLVVALILLLNYDAVSSVEVHFESKDGGFFLKHSPRTFYPTNLRPEYTPSTPSGSSSSSTGSSGATSGSSGSTTVSSSSMPGGPRLEPGNSVLSVDKFTVFQTSEPVSVRATYGPFSTKQTVPARYIVPDLLDSLPASSTDPKKINGTGGLTSKTLVDVQELGARHLDMSAHIVNPSIPRDAPVLRVLFHAGSEATGRRQSILGRQQRVCVLLHGTPSVQPNSRNRDMESLVAGPLTATCSPDGQDGVCLAQITVPASWWPPLPPPDTAGRIKPVKTLPRIVQLSYSVMEPRTTDDAGHTLDASSAAFCQPKVQIQPLTPLGQVTLAPNRATYKELKTDEYLTLLVPHGPLYPRSRLHIPVFLQSHSSKQATQNRPPVAAVVLRARVKAGVKILDASTSSPDWVIESDINLKNTAATFTARRKENVSRLPNASAEEIMTMLLEASEESTESKEHGGGGRIVWSVRYALEGEEDNVSLAGPFQATQPHYHHHNNGHSSDRKKLQAHLEIQKDDIQAVLPISKNWEVMNTAVLTGRQISQAMKVFIVSQAGTVADVTLQSSCHSEDESVLKVSTSCSSVYVDGSELRGSSNASVLVKYGTYTGLAQFTTWMPEFPLEVSVTDTRLNQIKGWKVPEEHHLLAKNKRSLNATDEAAAVAADASDKKRSTPSDVPDKEDDMDYEEEDIEEADVDEEDGEDLTEGKMRFRSGDKWDEINSIDRGTTSTNCRLRFQQSPVEVHARFKAEDLNSGRVSYFVNRRTWLRVTDLVAGLLRVSDPRIATLLQGRIVQGKGIGRTEVQVLSPINGRVIGAKELRVGNDRVSVSQLSVKVVTGIQLTISPDSAIENGYIAETSVTRKLTAKYQEGLLDIDIEFSDGSRTPLRDISVSDYHLGVESLDTEVVAFAPMAASHHPRVIAVGEGRGDLLRISLQLADVCRQSPNRRSKSSVSRPATAPAANPPPALPLATATAHVEVDFDSSELPSRPEFVQNDGGVGLGGHHRERKNGRDLAPDLHDILIGGMGGVGVRHSSHNSPRMTPLEIGMYVLLAAFCFAIVVFLVGCVVIASKLKPQPSEGNGAPGSGLPNIPVLEAARAAASQFSQNRRARESTTNAHDWVWLGRATLDACGPQQVRVTRNPLAGEPEDETMDLASSFDNPNHIELPTRNKRSGPIDSTTYCKRDRQRNLAANRPLLNNDNDNDSPPPLPPHNASASWSENGNVAEDYKPPIPPHRNTSNGLTRMPDTPKRRHHHQRASSNGGDHEVGGRRHESSKHHHHRVSKSGRSKSNSSNNSNSNSNGNNSNGSSSGSGKLPIDVVNENGSADLAYVEVRNRDPEARSKRARSREKKRATVVGNPMFSSTSSNSSDSPTHAANDNQGLHLHHENEMQQSNTNATTSSTGLDDLNLGMDYNQIMQYFENLKESNA